MKTTPVTVEQVRERITRGIVRALDGSDLLYDCPGITVMRSREDQDRVNVEIPIRAPIVRAWFMEYPEPVGCRR